MHAPSPSHLLVLAVLAAVLDAPRTEEAARLGLAATLEGAGLHGAADAALDGASYVGPGAGDGEGWAAQRAARVAEVETRLEREAELEDAARRPLAVAWSADDEPDAAALAGCDALSDEDADWDVLAAQVDAARRPQVRGTRDREYGLQREDWRLLADAGYRRAAVRLAGLDRRMGAVALA